MMRWVRFVAIVVSVAGCNVKTSGAESASPTPTAAAMRGVILWADRANLSGHGEEEVALVVRSPEITSDSGGECRSKSSPDGSCHADLMVGNVVHDIVVHVTQDLEGIADGRSSLRRYRYHRSLYASVVQVDPKSKKRQILLRQQDLGEDPPWQYTLAILDGASLVLHALTEGDHFQVVGDGTFSVESFNCPDTVRTTYKIDGAKVRELKKTTKRTASPDDCSG